MRDLEGERADATREKCYSAIQWRVQDAWCDSGQVSRSFPDEAPGVEQYPYRRPGEVLVLFTIEAGRTLANA